MNKPNNRNIISAAMIFGAFSLGVICTLLIGAAEEESKVGLSIDRDPDQLRVVFVDALTKYLDEVGTDRIELSKTELWDFVELGYLLGVYSHSANRSDITAYYNFQMLRNARGSPEAYANKYISEHCERMLNRFSRVLRRKFETNSTEFKETFRALHSILGKHADAENAYVMCPFEEVGLSLYPSPENPSDALD